MKNKKTSTLVKENIEIFEITLNNDEDEKIYKKDLNPKIHLSEGNIKSKCTDNVTFITWSLPSRKTCVYATEGCTKRCFAKKNETFQCVISSRNRNFDESKKDSFVKDMINHLKYHLQRPKNLNKKIFVRIHTSGDFYSLDYFKKWVEISNYFKENDSILFQCYTKSMPIIDEYIDELKEDNLYASFSDSEILRNSVNIRLVWSIWKDTKEEYTCRAKELNLQCFTALPKGEVPIAVNNGYFECTGECGKCEECYTGISLKIVIAYH